MKRENYLLENFTNEFENDIVFARYINYMKKALLNRKLDFLKHQKYINQKEQTISDEEWTILSNKGNSVHSFFNVQNNIGFESSIELKIAIDKLTEKQKQIIILHYYNKKPLNVIAKELKMKDSAVRQLKYKAIIKLKKYYEILSNAKNDEVSLIIAVNKIMPLINKYSIINNQIDEDLRSYLIEYAIKLIKSDDFADKLKNNFS